MTGAAPGAGGNASELGHFAALFGADAARLVEYSFSSAPDRYGAGIPGTGPAFWQRVRRFAGRFPYAARWIGAVDRLAERLQPPAFFFKVDWGAERALRITIYFRFEAAVAEAPLLAALAGAAPLAWNGPSPHALGACLGDPAPFIIGFRTGLDGHQVAMYYRARASREHVIGACMPALAAALSLPATTPAAVRDALAGVVGFGAPSIVGIDSPRDGESAQLKLDVAGVTVADALQWIRANGAGDARVRTLAAPARRMRIEVLSYCGAKVGAEGMAGWKLYMPVRPIERVAGAPRLRAGDDQRRIAGILW